MTVIYKLQNTPYQYEKIDAYTNEAGQRIWISKIIGTNEIVQHHLTNQLAQNIRIREVIECL